MVEHIKEFSVDAIIIYPEITITIMDSETQHIIYPSSEPQHSIVIITDEE